MSDQLFSVKNFRDIYDRENRKGRNIDFLFENNSKITETTSNIKDEIINRKNSKGRDRKEAIEKIKNLKKQKEDLLIQEFQKIISKIESGTNIFKIKQGNVFKNKQTFILEKNPENFFISKQIQENLKKIFKIEISSRNTILAQLQNILKDSLPKYIIRTDIKNFYETISHGTLLQQIKNNELLSTNSKIFINKIIGQYKSMGYSTGLPRGIGISAYLSEIYLKELDKQILDIKNIIYYARYVDDIIIVLTKDKELSEEILKNNIVSILKKLELEINDNKTIIIDTTQEQDKRFTFLGYDIEIKDIEETDVKVSFSLSNKKKDKYKDKIEIAFKIYERSKHKKKSAKQLYDRIKFLTSNIKLLNNKNNVIVGVHYSNTFLNNDSDFEELDCFLKEKINNIKNINLKEHLQGLSFQKGFHDYNLTKYTTLKLINTTKIWKKL